MTDLNYSTIVDEFDRHVRARFAYVESEFGFSSSQAQTRDLCEPRDAVVSIRYKTEDVGLTIGFSLIGTGISAFFKNLNWIEVPKNIRVKSVSLDSVAAYRTNGTAKSLLHELTSGRHKSWPSGFLLENMELAIATLATRVKQHGSDILNGDVSSFPEIINFEQGNIAT